MAKQTLAVKYRPKDFTAVTEQSEIIKILSYQISSGDIQHSYLFVGSAGTGKTTCARIFASEINHHKGHPIEIDAASNNSVDDVRNIIQQAKMRSIDSDYKVYIVDECHSLSNNAWQAFLKLLEEAPEKSIFIFCTTNPEKIPSTILSRVQRYDFKRISYNGIVDRLWYILDSEGYNDGNETAEVEAIEYIAKLASGGMRDAISMMDKCLSYSSKLTLNNVLDALGVSGYETMENLTDALIGKDSKAVIDIINSIHKDGRDLGRFVKSYVEFIIDVAIYSITLDYDYICIPSTEGQWLSQQSKYLSDITSIMDTVMTLGEQVRYETEPKYIIEAVLLRHIMGN